VTTNTKRIKLKKVPFDITEKGKLDGEGTREGKGTFVSGYTQGQTSGRGAPGGGGFSFLEEIEERRKKNSCLVEGEGGGGVGGGGSGGGGGGGGGECRGGGLRSWCGGVGGCWWGVLREVWGGGAVCGEWLSHRQLYLQITQRQSSSFPTSSLEGEKWALAHLGQKQKCSPLRLLPILGFPSSASKSALVKTKTRKEERKKNAKEGRSSDRRPHRL